MTVTRLFTTVGLAASLAMLAAGCATQAPRSSAAVAPYAEKLELEGNLSVNYVRDGKRESISGKFNWRQDGARTDVELASPLGQTIATIAVTPGEAVLKEGSKPPRSAPDVDALSSQVLGWPLPVSGLRDWLQGYAVAEDGKRFAASPARNEVVTRDGWRLSFVTWQDDSTPPAPRRIDARRGPGGDVEEIEIRIVVLQRTAR